jgi:hypothetical protein
VKWLVVVLAMLVMPARADMYQDMSNAVGGKRAGNYYAPAFGGCTWDATHDVGACVNAALTAAAAGGGGAVVVPAGIYGLSTKIVWPTTTPLALRCPAGGGSRGPATVFRWIGAAVGRMVEIRSDTGSGVMGAEVTQCGFDGNQGLAADGLYLASVDHGHFDDLRVFGGFNGGNLVNLTVDSPAGAGSQNNTFDNLNVQNGDGSPTVYTSNQFRLGAYIDPIDGVKGNAAFNTARNIIVGGLAGAGILCEGCDNNYISGRVYNNNLSVDLSIAVNGSHLFPANANVFSPFYYSGPFIARGQTSFPTCVGTTCSYANEAFLDQTNAFPFPTIEPGAELHWRSNFGYQSGLSLTGKSGGQSALVAAHDYSIWGTCVANQKTNGINTNIYECNSESGAYLQFDSVAGDRYGVDHVGAAGAKDLRFVRMAGAGSFRFDVAPVVLSITTVGGLPACNAGRKGAAMTVSDQLSAPTYRGALTAGGTIAVLAYCNGSAWEAH